MNELAQQTFAFDAVDTVIEDISMLSTPVLDKNDELLELDHTFNFEDFQVVRREFFAHVREPSITFNDSKFYVNSACLKKFPNAMYVQVLIDRESKILALKPCQEMTRDSFQWCREVKGKREPRQTRNRQHNKSGSQPSIREKTCPFIPFIARTEQRTACRTEIFSSPAR